MEDSCQNSNPYHKMSPSHNTETGMYTHTRYRGFCKKLLEINMKRKKKKKTTQDNMLTPRSSGMLK